MQDNSQDPLNSQNQTNPLDQPANIPQAPEAQTMDMQPPHPPEPLGEAAPPAGDSFATAKAKPSIPFKKIIFVLIGVIILIIIGTAAVVVLPKLTAPSATPTPTLEPSPTPIAIKEDQMSDFASAIAIEENTVSIAKSDNQYYLKYLGKVYQPQKDNEYDLTLSDVPEQALTWYGLVNPPEGSDLSSSLNQLFGFKQLPAKNPGVTFIMRWPQVSKDHFELYYFAYNEVSLITSFDVNPNKISYTIPKFYQINSAGTLGALQMFDCWECDKHYPQTLVVNFISKETQVLGTTSYFAWGENENFEYKAYIPDVDPETLPLKKGSFKF